MPNELKHKCNGCIYKGEHQEMGFRPFGVCTRTSNLIEAEMNYRARICPYEKFWLTPWNRRANDEQR